MIAHGKHRSCWNFIFLYQLLPYITVLCIKDPGWGTQKKLATRSAPSDLFFICSSTICMLRDDVIVIVLEGIKWKCIFLLLSYFLRTLIITPPSSSQCVI